MSVTVNVISFSPLQNHFSDIRPMELAALCDALLLAVASSLITFQPMAADTMPVMPYAAPMVAVIAVLCNLVIVFLHPFLKKRSLDGFSDPALSPVVPEKCVFVKQACVHFSIFRNARQNFLNQG